MFKLKKLMHESRHGIFMITYAIILFFIVSHLEPFFGIVQKVFSLLKPLFVGFCIAYVLNIPMARIENFLIKKFNIVYKKSRPIAIGLTLLFALVIITVLIFIIVPQLVDSMILLLNNLGIYIGNIIDYVVVVLENLHIQNDYINDVLNDLQNLPWNQIFGNIISLIGNTSNSLSNWASGLMNETMNIVGKVGTFITAFMISLYLLASKENYLRQSKNLLLAFFGQDMTNSLYELGGKINEIFKNFIGGQLLEASILFAMYGMSMMILQMPYALLISALIAVTSIIPYFGAMLGSAIGFILIFAINPMQAVGFFIFFQILQQIENNLIYPKVVGKSVGLPAIWVVIGIVVFGSLFGMVGMIVAVPTCAVLYQMIRTLVYMLLKYREIEPNEER